MAGIKPQLCRTGEGVVVIVPAFAKCNQAAKPNIMALNRRAFDVPIAVPGIVRKIADEPMTEN